MDTNKKWSALIVLLFFVWGGISYYWYTCGIKGFCNAPRAKMVQEKPKPKPQPHCTEYLTQHIKLGAHNDANEVRKLETFLVQHEHAHITIDGVYTQQDAQAVKEFQAKYAKDVLIPWGLTAPTGFVYKTTRDKINELYCASRT